MVKTPWHGKTLEDDPSDDYRQDSPTAQLQRPVVHDDNPRYDYHDAPPQSLYRRMPVRRDEEEE